jgi:hypothetical protein
MSQMDGLKWHKGRPCESGMCVEVAANDAEVLVRSSLLPASRITLTRDEWRDFLAGAKDGLFDHL